MGEEEHGEADGCEIEYVGGSQNLVGGGIARREREKKIDRFEDAGEDLSMTSLEPCVYLTYRLTQMCCASRE